MALGAKTGERVMNSDRDTYLYSSFCTCTNVSFLMNSDRDTHLYSSFRACTNVSFLMNSDRDTHLYSSFRTCTNVSFRSNSHSFIQSCIKFVQFIFLPLNIAVSTCCYSILGIWELKLAQD